MQFSSIRFFVTILFIYWPVAHSIELFGQEAATPNNRQSLSNHPKNTKFSMYTSKSKQVDCGQVDIDEDYDELNHIYEHDDIIANKTTYNDFVMFMNEEDNSIDSNADPYADPKLAFNLKTVTNLSACLIENLNKQRQGIHNNNSSSSPFISFSTHFASKLTQFVFDNYFYLDDKSGILYIKKRIDREIFCAKVGIEIEKLTELKLNRQKSSALNLTSLSLNNPSHNAAQFRASATKKVQKRSSAFIQRYSSNGGISSLFRPSVMMHAKFHDMVNCDCKSEKCEINFRFVAFKDRTNHVSGSGSVNSYKFMNLKVNVNDLNDNSPKFAKNSLHLNISENFGKNSKENEKKQNVTKEEDNSFMCNLIKTYNQNEFNANNPQQILSNSNSDDYFLLNSNNLIPIDKAFDLDVGDNANIDYKLILLGNSSYQLIDFIESEQNSQTKEKYIKDLISSGIEPCQDMFELIESNLVNQNENNNRNYGSSQFGKSLENSGDLSLLTLLFLKINKFLDREEQEVYNFVLIALDKQKQKKNALNLDPSGYLTKLVNSRNYVFIRLIVNDLNDNQPVFAQAKYYFNLDEVTEFSSHFNARHRTYILEKEVKINENKYYLSLLNTTCEMMRQNLRVLAIDSDMDLNSKVKYKLVQQVHRKSSRTSANVGSGPNAGSAGIGNFNILFDDESDSVFNIDEFEGTITLKVCKNLLSPTNSISSHIDRLKYLEYTILLDFETYAKHILVVEASDSNPFSPLQTIVTLEINLNDLNDNRPLILSMLSMECAKLGIGHDFNSMSLLSSLNSLDSSPSTTMTSEHLKVSIQHFNLQALSTVLNANRNGGDSKKFYSSKIVIDSVSEYSSIGKCLGQFQINDADTPHRNRRLEARVWLGSYDKLSETNLIRFNNLKDRDGLPNDQFYYDLETFTSNTSSSSYRDNVGPYHATNEIFELFLNFETDAEQQRFYEFTIELKDNGVPIAFTTYIQLIILIKDENDNVPKFEHNFYNFTIDEWTTTSNNTYNRKSLTSYSNCFGRIEAHDTDSTADNSAISYELSDAELFQPKFTGPNQQNHGVHQHHKKNTAKHLPHGSYLVKNTNSEAVVDSNGGLFYINTTTGQICVRDVRLLDREVKSKYEFVVTASNLNSSVHSNVLVQININDLNDNRPEFLQKAYTFFVIEKDSNLVSSLISNSDNFGGTRGRQTRPKSSISRKNMPQKLTFNLNTRGPLTYVGNVKALDRDANLNSNLIYYLDLRDNKSYYELNTDSLSLVLNDDLIKDKNLLIMDEDQLVSSNSNTTEEVDDEDEKRSRPAPRVSNEDRIVYEVTAIKYTLPNNELFSQKDRDKNVNENHPDEFIFKYANKNSTLPPSVSTSTSVKKLIHLSTKKFYRRIPNIDKIIYLNSSSGDIYLLEQPDREQIMNIRFNVYVKDGGDSSSVDNLNNSVPVVVEIIDINDSRPQCSSQKTLMQVRNAYKREKSSPPPPPMVVSNKPLDIYSLKVDANKIEQSVLSSSVRLVKLYKFKCKDADLNKNGEIKYEIDRFFLKETSQKSKRKIVTTNLPPIRFDDELTTSTPIPDMTSLMGPDEVNDFINEFFILNANTGVLYLNVNAYLDSVFYSRLRTISYNKFIVIRVRVSDNGLVALTNVYHLKFLFCFFDEPNDENAARETETDLSELKYCKFKMYANSDHGGKVRPVFIKSLSDLDSYKGTDEEANLNDISDSSRDEDENGIFIKDKASTEVEIEKIEEDIYVDIMSRSRYNYDISHLTTNLKEKTTKRPGNNGVSLDVINRPIIDGYMFSSASVNSFYWGKIVLVVFNFVTFLTLYFYV